MQFKGHFCWSTFVFSADRPTREENPRESRAAQEGRKRRRSLINGANYSPFYLLMILLFFVCFCWRYLLISVFFSRVSRILNLPSTDVLSPLLLPLSLHRNPLPALFFFSADRPGHTDSSDPQHQRRGNTQRKRSTRTEGGQAFWNSCYSRRRVFEIR